MVRACAGSWTSKAGPVPLDPARRRPRRRPTRAPEPMGTPARGVRDTRAACGGCHLRRTERRLAGVARWDLGDSGLGRLDAVAPTQTIASAPLRLAAMASV